MKTRLPIFDMKEKKGERKMGKIILKGREIPLIYTTYEMKLIQERIGPLAEAIGKVYGAKDEKAVRGNYGQPEQLEAMAKMICILGNAGLEEAGENPDLEEKKILRAIRPNAITIAQLVNEILNTLNEGMASEIPQEKTNGPVDVVLEEINKKKEKVS